MIYTLYARQIHRTILYLVLLMTPSLNIFFLSGHLSQTVVTLPFLVHYTLPIGLLLAIYIFILFFQYTTLVFPEIYLVGKTFIEYVYG